MITMFKDAGRIKSEKTYVAWNKFIDAGCQENLKKNSA